ncbi:hypothetical protein O4H66_18940 [Comamonadaceae bacterium G21597-S1]|nr:hypothetical protein [Comamonadaceae bacterium G21597-S1]
MPSITSPTSQAETATQSVALFDHRPFFEKALQHGVRHGIIPAERLDAMRQEAPKGIVQIARYFGTEFLRPELELARDRMVNLISLYLEDSCDADLDRAAQSLRDHSLLSRSKGGADMLKALIGMPRSSHFGMQEAPGFRDEHIPLLAKWSLRTPDDYRAERSQRLLVGQMVDAARWMVNGLGMDADALADAGADAEAVIRTALLMGIGRRPRTMPDWPAFEKQVAALRKVSGPTPLGETGGDAIPLPGKLPAALRDVVESVRQSVRADLPRICDPALPIRRLFTQTPAFIGRYFWNEDALAQLEAFERQNSTAWDKATGGHQDDSSLLTLFLRIAAGSSHSTLLTPAAAASLVRKVRKSGLDPELPRQFIRQHAPVALQDDYLHLWDVFAQEAEPLLRSDKPYAQQDAMALLRSECNVAASTTRR